MTRVTLQVVADRVGVSRMTVSNAFSRPDQLSAELRVRILKVADELGYAGPDPAGRSLARGTTGTIGVLWTGRLRYSLTDEISARFLGAVADELAPTGLALTLLGLGVYDDVVPARDVAMDGAIVYTADPDSDAVGWLRRRGLPLVYVDTDAPDGVPTVRVDDRGGAAMAASHLLDLGHRRIGIISAELGPTGLVAPGAAPDPATMKRVGRERLLGWRDTVRRAGVEPLLAAQENGYEDARGAATALLDRPDRPTAVLCLSDLVANDVARAAEALGLHVPTDVSIVGFDDHPLATRITPPLTTVRQDVDAKGHAAASALRAAITGAEAESVLLPVELVVRGSTAPPP